MAATGVQSLSLLDPTSFADGLFLSWQVYALGFVVAAVVGAGALWLVLRLLYRGHFRVFAVYVVALALFVLVTQPNLGESPSVDELPLDEEQLHLQQR